MKKIVSVFLLVVLFSCVNRKQQKLDEIRAAESDLFSDSTGLVNTAKADKVIGLYGDFVKDYPSDSAAAKMMFKEAEILMSINKAAEAVRVLDSMIIHYPESELLPQAMHLQGFIYDDKLHNVQMAKRSFERLIKRFPDNELARNAKDYMKILGKSPEEIIKEFEMKNKADSVSAEK